MATKKGLEPSTSGVTGRRSNQLSYLAIAPRSLFHDRDILYHKDNTHVKLFLRRSAIFFFANGGGGGKTRCGGCNFGPRRGERRCGIGIKIR